MSRKYSITIFNTSASGSNTYFLYNHIPNDIKAKYDIRMLTLDEARATSDIHDSDVYITTHGEYPVRPDKINIELWHGFPLKGMATMDINETISSEAIYKHWSNMDLIMSYSPFYNTLINSCFGGRISQYRVTGMPRNDALFDSGSRSRLLKLFPSIQNKKTACFLPTFRHSVHTPDKKEGEKSFDNVFGFKQFDDQEFRGFLNDHNLALVIKLHPFEEKLYAHKIKDWAASGIYLLTNGMLANAGYDLYEVLGAADMLMTDYSSVYFDYLLLDRPIVFVPVDLDTYAQSRGLLLSPYDLWTPGPKALSQTQLQAVIKQALDNPEWYGEERERIARIAHAYRDNQSAERVWRQIDQYIAEKEEKQKAETERQRELAAVQLKVKEQIAAMIESGSWSKASSIIDQYLQSSDLDAEILSMKGIVQLLGGSSTEAINTLTTGHRLFPENFDVCYNLAFAYESAGEASSAAHFYRTALHLTTDSNARMDVEHRLNEILQAQKG